VRKLVAAVLLAPALAAAQLPAPGREALARAGVPESAVGAVVEPVGGGKRLAGHLADKALNPASTMKLVTTYAALDMLGWRDARLVLVGGREIGQEYARSFDERYGRWIVRLPRFGMEDMPAVVAAAHVVVVPQRDTPVARAQFPMKITDAMAMAKPIISTRVGDIEWALEGAAYLVNPSSPQEIAGALASVFADPAEAARRGREARRRCEERFSTTAVAGIMRGILEGKR